MAGRIVQEAQNSSSSPATTIAVTLSSPVTAGSILHVFAHNYSGSTTANNLTFTDNQGNSYTPLGNTQTTYGGDIDSWSHAYAVNVKGGTTTVTMHTPSGQYIGVWAREIAGVAQASALAGANTISSVTSPVTAANTVSETGFMSALGSTSVFGLFGGAGNTLVPSSPLVQDVEGWSYSGSLSYTAISSHREVSTTGSATAVYTYGADTITTLAVMMAIFLEGEIVVWTGPIKFFANGSIHANSIIQSAPGGKTIMKMYMANGDIQVASAVSGGSKVSLLANGQLQYASTI